VSATAIVTDSTAYIPDDLVRKYGIHVAPQILIWGEETIRDGVDIMPAAFYERLKTATVMPTTSQVTIAYFHELFQKLAAEGKQILAILVSSKLSGTISSAVQAKEMLPQAKIEIVDSLSTAMALGFQVLAAARADEAGKTFARWPTWLEAAWRIPESSSPSRRSNFCTAAGGSAARRVCWARR